MILPPAKNARFFNRTEIVAQIDEHFGLLDSQKWFRSLALYGLAGVGKSIITQKYAEEKTRMHQLDAVFWIHGGKPMSIRQSFTDIAMRLRLPDARPQSHEDNRIIVLNWLPQTQCEWLLIYDSVETIYTLLPYWPTASKGQALITTRNRTLGFELADRGVEVTSWDAEKGSRFLMHLLSGTISIDLLESESKSAFELSDKLSGHALALAQMAGIIHRRSWSIAEFVEMYDRQSTKLHGTSLGHGALNTLWHISFQSLELKSLFEVTETAGIDENLAFVSDEIKVSETLDNLLVLALIRRDKETRSFSIHLLVQTHYKLYISPQVRQNTFLNVAELLYQAFPKPDASKAQLYDVWERCALYLEHVLSIKDAFKKERTDNQSFKASSSFCKLLVTCER